MDRIKQLREKLQNIDVMSQVVVIARRPEIRQRMIKQNQTQLSKGLKTDNKRILPNYSAEYKRKRNRMGFQTSFVDLKIKGTLYENIDMFVKKDSILFFSRVPYAQYLEKRYATPESHIFGLNDEGLEILKSELVIDIRKQIGL